VISTYFRVAIVLLTSFISALGGLVASYVADHFQMLFGQNQLLFSIVLSTKASGRMVGHFENYKENDRNPLSACYFVLINFTLFQKFDLLPAGFDK
jgi:uncharacterized membrane protein (DUF485 family)